MVCRRYHCFLRNLSKVFGSFPLPFCLLELLRWYALHFVDDWFSLPPETLGLGHFIDARLVGWLAWCILSLFTPEVRLSIYLSSLPLLHTVVLLLGDCRFCLRKIQNCKYFVHRLFWSHIGGESIYHIIRSSSDRPSTATAVFGWLCSVLPRRFPDQSLRSKSTISQDIKMIRRAVSPATALGHWGTSRVAE